MSRQDETGELTDHLELTKLLQGWSWTDFVRDPGRLHKSVPWSAENCCCSSFPSIFGARMKWLLVAGFSVLLGRVGCSHNGRAHGPRSRHVPAFARCGSVASELGARAAV